MEQLNVEKKSVENELAGEREKAAVLAQKFASYLENISELSNQLGV